jgi:microcystin-dependent protein
MAETYANSLKLTNIGDGDLAGTWGQTTNTNICTLLVQAITGVIGITMTDANYTLSNINGTSDESRNAVIVVSGTNTAIRTVYTPYNSGASKLYTFFNNTTGGYAIQIQAANSGTPTGNYVTIPTGVTAAVYFDGINFYSANSGSAGNFTVNGTLTSSGVTDLGALSVAGTTTLSGTSTALTPSTGDNSTKIATTAFVQNSGLVGEIKMWGTGTAPTGYLFCNGASVSTTTYASLFAVIGYTYGGSGASFTLPDFSGRMPIGVNGTYTLASTGGAASTTLAETNLPSHSHSASSSSSVSDPGHFHQMGAKDSTANEGGDTAYEFVKPYPNILNPNSSTVTTGITVSTSTSIGNTGSGTSFTNLPPYLGIYYIIKT